MAHLVPITRLGATDAQVDTAVAAQLPTTITPIVEQQVPPLVAESIAADPTPANAAAAAVDDALGDADIVATEVIPEDVAEFRAEDGSIIFAVDDIYGTPHLRGSKTYTETHLIVAAGQSNSYGVGGPTPDGTNTSLGNLFTIPQSGEESGSLVPATDPLAHPTGAASVGNRGHAVRFGQLYAAAHPGVRVVIVPVAQAGTGFRSDATISWAPAREAEVNVSLYRDAIDATNAAAAMFAGVVRVAAVLWHQGEDDAVALTTSAQYSSDLDALISGFRAEMANAADVPFIVGQFVEEFISVRAEGTVAEIDAVHQATPGRVLRTGFASNPGSGYAKTDNTHYDGHGQWLLAQSYWDAYLSSLYNL